MKAALLLIICVIAYFVLGYICGRIIKWFSEAAYKEIGPMCILLLWPYVVSGLVFFGTINLIYLLFERIERNIKR